ncbi:MULTISPECIES: hypothetical protein [unclassified Ruegeria]|uniref:hypothetical protein n=1 Tax=unclassified Ruegeria TaxID=2625375 RepID=UPI0014885A21|nr:MULTISPECIES: hypothetical protein [unclassified Ruegeria]
MKKRWFVIASVLALLGLTYVYTSKPQSEVKVSDGRAVPMGASGELFMVTLNLQNDGSAVVLQGVTSPSGAAVSFMNPGYDGRLVVPGGDTAQLAMDGAHVVLRVPQGTFPAGGFHSLALEFDDGSEVSARILHPEVTAATAMDHSATIGIALSPGPTIALVQDPEVRPEGFDVEIRVENFEFTRVDDSAPHVDGQGHAHIYLNGLKLGRLYEERFAIGTLAPGEYVLSVVLNTNDHRPYVSNGEPVVLSYAFTL